MCIFFQPASRMYSTPVSGGSGVAKSDVFFVASFQKEEEIRKKMRLGRDALWRRRQKTLSSDTSPRIRACFREGVKRAFFCTYTIWEVALGSAAVIRKWLRTTTNWVRRQQFVPLQYRAQLFLTGFGRTLGSVDSINRPLAPYPCPSWWMNSEIQHKLKD